MLLLWSTAAKAQESFSWEEHRHSLEVYTGYPYFFTMLIPKSSPDNTASMEGWYTGDSYKFLCPENLSLMYSYRDNKEWEISAVVNLHGYFYNHKKYPVVDNIPDWDAVPEDLGVKYEARGIVTGLITRRYWVEKPGYRLYSAFGLGVLLKGRGILGQVVPELTPIGIRFGRRHIYGMTDLSYGPTGIGLRLGTGYRF